MVPSGQQGFNAQMAFNQGFQSNQLDLIKGIKKLENQTWLSSNSNGSSSINTAIVTGFCLSKRLFSLRFYLAKC